MPLPESDPGHSIPRRSRRASALMAFASLAELWLHPIRSIRRARSGPARPTFDDLRRMDPERLAAWHQETGIEDRVGAAMGETEGDVEQAQALARVPPVQGGPSLSARLRLQAAELGIADDPDHRENRIDTVLGGRSVVLEGNGRS